VPKKVWKKVREKTLIKMQIMVTIAALSCTAGLRATTLARLSLDQMAAASDSVARLRCVAVQSRWENGAIWTVTTFDVVETMKGSLSAQVKVRLPGGRVGHLTATVDGTPKFNPGGEAIVFLEVSRAGGYSVAGWVEGTFRITRDPHTARETVTQDSSAIEVFDTATRSFITEGVRRMPVEQFRARVATAIAHQQEKAQ
jgi:hypothetical protein